MNDTKKFIENLELYEPVQKEHFMDYKMYESHEETPSFLNFKGLNSFTSNVSRQVQEDVLNSLLLAQRAATKAFPEDVEVYDWYKLYFKVLQHLGWLISQKDFNTYDEDSNSFELDKAILSLLQDFLTGQQIKVIMKSIELLKSLGSDDKRLVAFERDTHAHGRGNFQIGMAEEENGNVSVLGSGFILQSKKKITKILFLKFGKDKINMKFSFYKAELVSSEFAKYRELVKEKLGDVSPFIASLDI